jgi:hypothetical protein
VATLHDATTSHFGRALSGETVPLLARHPWFSEGLTSRETPLMTDDHRALLYSADLTAATEWISHDIAQAIIRGIGTSLEWNPLKATAALNMVGPQNLRLDTDFIRTTNSVLLGAGISWTILSVVNAFAASQGDLNDRTFKICGDDLLGLWSRNRINSYDEQIKSTGLVLNKAKSFVHPRRGVFCERLETKVAQFAGATSRGRAISFSTRATAGIGLREASGAKLFGRKGRTGLYSVRESLGRRLQEKGTAGPIRRVILNTMKRTTPRGTCPGPTSLGGNGGRIENPLQALRARRLFASYIKKGPVHLTRGCGDAEWSEFSRTIRDNLRMAEGGVPEDDVLATARIAYQRKRLGTSIQKVREKDLHAIRRTAKGRELQGKEALSTGESLRFWPSQVREWAQRELTRTGRRLVHSLLPKILFSKPQTSAMRKLCRVPLHHLRTHQVDPQGAAVFLGEQGLSPAYQQDGKLRPWGFLGKSKPVRQRARVQVSSSYNAGSSGGIHPGLPLSWQELSYTPSDTAIEAAW